SAPSRRTRATTVSRRIPTSWSEDGLTAIYSILSFADDLRDLRSVILTRYTDAVFGPPQGLRQVLVSGLRRCRFLLVIKFTLPDGFGDLTTRRFVSRLPHRRHASPALLPPRADQAV